MMVTIADARSIAGSAPAACTSAECKEVATKVAELETKIAELAEKPPCGPVDDSSHCRLARESARRCSSLAITSAFTIRRSSREGGVHSARSGSSAES